MALAQRERDRVLGGVLEHPKEPLRVASGHHLEGHTRQIARDPNLPVGAPRLVFDLHQPTKLFMVQLR